LTESLRRPVSDFVEDVCGCGVGVQCLSSSFETIGRFTFDSANPLTFSTLSSGASAAVTRQARHPP
jgi:hypothetical protein